MRIALVNNFFLPRTSGSAHQVAQLARDLAKEGHEVIVLTSAQGAEPGNSNGDGYRIIRYPCLELPPLELAMRYDVNFAISPRNARAIYSELDEFRPDVLHQHGQFFDLTWMTGMWSRSRRVPTALTVHTPLVHTNPFYSRMLWTADVTLVRRLVHRWSPRFVATDAYMCDYVARRYRVRNSAIMVIPLGVNPSELRGGNGSEVRTRLGVGERPMILSLGHVIPIRNRLLLVDALPRVLSSSPDAVLVVAGSINDERFLHRARQLEVEKSVITTGPIPYCEVPSYLAAANVECHEEGLGSGLGTATLEVMATGTPVVAVADPDSFVGFRLQDRREIVLAERDNPASLADAITMLLSDPKLARDVGLGGQRLVEERFTFERSTSLHLELYDRMVTASRNGTHSQATRTQRGTRRERINR